MWLALDAGRVVGLEQMRLRGNGFAENGFTAADRSYRGRGIARALKTRQIEWARHNGIMHIVTWNDASNAPMLAVKGWTCRGRARLLLFLGGVRTPAGPVLSLDETVTRWRAIDRCQQETPRNELPASETDPTSVERMRYGGGHGGTAVESWVVHGGGHTWPGGPRLPILGRTSTRFDAGEVIWQFVASHFYPASERRLDGNSAFSGSRSR